MHVGVYVYDYIPNAGGGYTFQREILKAVVDLAGNSQHVLSVLGHLPNELLKDKTSLGTINFIPIEQPQVEPSGRGGILHRLRKRDNISASTNILSPLDYTAKKNNIEFIWFITPAYEVTDVPYMGTVWDLQHRLQPWFPEVGKLLEWQGRETYISTFLRRATYIIAANEAGRDEISGFYQIPKDRIACIGHPVPVLHSVSSLEEEQTLLKYGLKRGYLFYPAQYWAHKNHANLLFALKVLKDDDLITPSVVFVGSDKGNLSHLKKLAIDLDVASQVHFLGFVDDVELAALYKNALALVYLSFFGPENLPPLEAFSVGCPVIASQVSGAREQLGEAALLVNPTNIGEIALSIKSLQDDGQRQELIARGFERANKTTSLDYVNQVFALLDQFQVVRRAWGSSYGSAVENELV